MNRRAFLAVPLALAACGPTNNVIATVSDDAIVIANGLQAILPRLATVAGMSTSTLAIIANAVASLQATAQALKGASSTAQAQGFVQKIETYVNTIVSVLASFNLPPPIGDVLTAADVLLPIIEVAVGLVLPARARYRAMATTMAPDKARTILRNAEAVCPGRCPRWPGRLAGAASRAPPTRLLAAS